MRVINTVINLTTEIVQFIFLVQSMIFSWLHITHSSIMKSQLSLRKLSGCNMRYVTASDAVEISLMFHCVYCACVQFSRLPRRPIKASSSRLNILTSFKENIGPLRWPAEIASTRVNYVLRILVDCLLLEIRIVLVFLFDSRLSILFYEHHVSVAKH